MGIERVAVIGATGNEGFGLAARWARAGIDVVVGSRAVERAVEAVERMRELVPEARASGLANADAAASASAVVVAVPFAGQAAIYRSIAPSVGADSVVVDCTSPLASAVGGRAGQMLGVWQGSAAEQAAELLGDRTVCAAFHTLSASKLGDLDLVLEGDVLACGPKRGKRVVSELVEALGGLRFVDAGPLANARILESLTALLIGINRRHKVSGAGIHVTGLQEPSGSDSPHSGE